MPKGTTGYSVHIKKLAIDLSKDFINSPMVWAVYPTSTDNRLLES